MSDRVTCGCPAVAPPWEVVVLVSQYLTPKSLASCSCVCKLWFNTLSSDQVWKPVCVTHYPSLSLLFQQQQRHNALPTDMSYRRLYALAYDMTCKIRRLRSPSKPEISLENLTFAVDIFGGNSHLLNVVRQGEDLVHKDGVFCFDSDVDFEIPDEMFGAMMRVTWTILMKGWTGVFTAMDRGGEGMTINGGGGGGGERWFSQELPSSPGCCWCSSTSSSYCNNNGLVAELCLGFSNMKSRRKKIQKLKMGILSIGSWRYTNINDALLYLQHFLLHFR